MYNYRVAVGDFSSSKVVRVVVGSITAVLSLTARNIAKRREVGIFPTRESATHKNAHAAQAYIEVHHMMPEKLFNAQHTHQSCSAPGN